MKKKFLPSYTIPKLVKGSSKWYIDFQIFNRQTKKYDRHRPTFGINRIHNLLEREKRGALLRQKIQWWIEKGKPIEKFQEWLVPNLELVAVERPEEYNTPLDEAIEVARILKCNTPRKETIRGYTSTCKLFLRFMKKRGWDKMMIGDFQLKQAIAYMDHCVLDRGVGNNTYNNNLRNMRTIFNTLKERSYLSENPFNQIKYKKKQEKKRRNFTLQESQIVAKEIYKQSKVLFYGLLLQYACYIRPSELRRMRFNCLDLENNLIHIPGQDEKNYREKTLTIPDDFRHFFNDPFFTEYPGHYLIFGEHFKPSPHKPCGERSMNEKQGRIMKDLKKRGKLENIENLSWYSWKDTGITDALYSVHPSGVQDQANHASMSMTMKYRHKRKLNKHMKEFKNRILPT